MSQMVFDILKNLNQSRTEMGAILFLSLENIN